MVATKGRRKKSLVFASQYPGAVIDFYPGYEIKDTLYRGKIVKLMLGETRAQRLYVVQPTHSTRDALSPKWIREFDLPPCSVLPRFIKAVVLEV